MLPGFLERNIADIVDDALLELCSIENFACSAQSDEAMQKGCPARRLAGPRTKGVEVDPGLIAPE